MVVTDKIARKHVIVKTREVVTISQEHAIVHPDGGVQCKYLFYAYEKWWNNSKSFSNLLFFLFEKFYNPLTSNNGTFTNDTIK